MLAAMTDVMENWIAWMDRMSFYAVSDNERKRERGGGGVMLSVSGTGVTCIVFCGKLLTQLKFNSITCSNLRMLYRFV